MKAERIPQDLSPFFELEGVPILPLTVGVTGHRKMSPSFRDSLKRETCKYFRELCVRWKRWNRGVNVPILVFNGMASGADQLVAEVLTELKQEPETSCLKLIATLPMPYEEYRKDFDTPESLEKFEMSVQKADAQVIIPLTEENQALRNSGENSEIDRPSQYQALGEYLASNSFLLLALWNGEMPTASPSGHKSGGTCDVVRMKLTGFFNPRYSGGLKHHVPLNKSHDEIIQPRGCVFQISTPVEDVRGETSPSSVKTYAWLPQDLHHPPLGRNISEKKGKKIGEKLKRRQIYNICAKHFFQMKPVKNQLKLLGIANHDLLGIRRSAQFSVELKNSQNELLEDYPVEPSGNLQLLVRYYTFLDVTSQKYQNKFYFFAVFYILLCVLFGSIFYMESFFKPIEAPEWTVGAQGFRTTGIWTTWKMALDLLYYVFLILLFILFFIYQKLRYYERYHRYRAVAEALRVQIFWHIIGIDERGMDHYRYHQVTAMNWLRLTANTILIPLNAEKDVAQDHPGMGFLLKHWIQAQKDYFQKKLDTLHQKKQFWHRILFVLTIFALSWPFFRIWVSRIQFDPEYYVAEVLFSIFTVMFALSGILGMGCYLYSHLKCYDSLSNRYSKIFPIYRRYEEILQAKMELCEEVDVATLEQFHQIGIYALTENADWFLIQRKLELPK